MDHILKKQFSELKTYIPGRLIEDVQKQYGLQKVIKLASNENYLGPMPAAVRAINENIANINRYPDNDALMLRRAISSFYNLEPKDILIGNGSNELLRIAGQAVLCPGEEVIFAHPSFVMYEMIAKLFEAKPVAVPLKNHTHDLAAMLDAITKKTKLIFICNPNNPTGTMISRIEIEKFINSVPQGILVVVDEAYAEFVENKEMMSLNFTYSVNKPIIVTRTFSKLFGLAGMRVGYGVAPSSYVEADRKIRDPFNVNILAQSAATASLEDKKEVEKRYWINVENRNYLYEGIESLNYNYVQSQANFVLMDVEQDSTIVFEKLLEKGVIVRTGEIFGEIYRNFIRVSVGSKEEIDFFLNALGQVK